MTRRSAQPEKAYRFLLRAYPRRWRAHREDEVVSLLTEVARAEGRRRPALSEAGDLLVHGLATRAEVGLRCVPAVVRERVALLGLLTGAWLAAVAILLGEWLPWVDLAARPGAPSFGPFLTTGVLPYGAWMLALALFLSGRAGAARLVVIVSIALGLLTLPLFAVTGVYRPPLFLLGVLTLLGLCAAQSRARLTPGGRATAGLWTVAVVTAMTLLAQVGDSGSFDARIGFYRGYSAGLQVIGDVVLLVLPVAVLAAVALSLRGRAWLAAVLVVSVPWAALAAATRFARPIEAMPALVTLAAVVGLVLICWFIAFRLGIRVRVERVARSSGVTVPGS